MVLYIPIFYEIPLFVFIVVAIYAIYQLTIVREQLAPGDLRDAHMWLIAGVISFTLWGLDHLYHDLVPLSAELQLFFHYVISHAFLMIAMICIGISAKKTKDVYLRIVGTNGTKKITKKKMMGFL